MKKLLLTTALLFVLTFSLTAKISCTSSGNGNWSSTFSCSGTGIQVYTIRSGDTITVNVSSTTLIDTIIINGVLNFNTGRKVDLTTNGIVIVNNGGKVTGGSSGSKFTFAGGTDIVGSFNISGPMYGKGSTSGAFITGVPLPLKWVDIKAVLNNRNVDLHWTTVDEKNNSHFEIECSSDGNDWKNIATVKASNIANQLNSYTYSYPVPGKGIYYYRVKQIDLNGEYSYSSLAYVRFDEIIRLSVYPNPASEFVNVQIEDLTLIKSVVLMNMNGQVMTEITEPNAQIRIDTKHYAKGQYTLSITGTDGIVSTLKVIID